MVRWPTIAWIFAILVALAGLALHVGVSANWGGLLLTIGGALLLLRVIPQAQSSPIPQVAAVASLPTVVAIAALAPDAVSFTPDIPFHWSLLIAVTGAQVMLLIIGRASRRHSMAHAALPVVGHLSVLTGTWLLATEGATSMNTAQVAFAGGLAVLALHALWMRRSRATTTERDTSEGWEPTFLVLLLVQMGGALFAYVLDARPDGAVAVTLASVGRIASAVAFIGVFALLARPPAPPSMLRARPGGLVSWLSHGTAALGLFNVVFMLFAIVLTWSARVLVVFIAVWVAFTVMMEYRSMRHAMRSRSPSAVRACGPVPPVRERVTVLVPARDEAQTLAASLRTNLALSEHFTFILLPAESSADDTVAVAEAAARADPERIRVIRGSTGTKAGDLNLAWANIRTDLVLMLDADETIDAVSAARAVEAMRTDASIGVVQGRKVSQAPDASALSRFVVAERRHATALDQPMHAGLGSTHFAGSAALVRKRVVDELGGWTSATMTEDIEFTLRMHLGSDARIAYDPHMVVRESDPANIGALVQQRTRWARGWMQCFVRFFPEVLRSRERLGTKRWFGLTWLLLSAVTAPLMALLPAMLLLRALGVPALLPVALGLALGVFVLPARTLGYGYAAMTDDRIPLRRRSGRMAELAFHAYAWIPFGWLVHFQALYQELASAPHVWYVTNKRVDRTSPAPAAIPPES